MAAWDADTLRPLAAFALPSRGGVARVRPVGPVAAKQADGSPGGSAARDSAPQCDQDLAVSGGSAHAGAGRGASRAPGSLRPSSLSLTPDGRSVLVGCAAPALVLVYDMASGALRHGVALPRRLDSVADLYALPDSTRAAVLGADGSIFFVDCESGVLEGELRLEGESGGVNGASSSGSASGAAAAARLRAEGMSIDSGSNLLVALAGDGSARVFDLAVARRAMAARRRTAQASAVGQLGATQTNGSAAAGMTAGAKPPHGWAAMSESVQNSSRLTAAEVEALLPHVLEDAHHMLLPLSGAAHAVGNAAKETAQPQAPAERRGAHCTAAAGSAHGARLPRLLAPGGAALSRGRLEEMLATFGAYPERFRLIVW